jgi:hypothetical protein
MRPRRLPPPWSVFAGVASNSKAAEGVTATALPSYPNPVPCHPCTASAGEFDGLLRY